jgi:hypothetical protein
VNCTHVNVRSENTIVIRYTDEADDTTEPQQLSVQHPNSIAEVCLNDERRDCRHYRNINGGEMGILEALHIAESGNKPKVEVGPSQGCLDGLQYEEEISCSRVCLEIIDPQRNVGTHLEVLWIVCRLRNCSYICLYVGERRNRASGNGVSLQIWTQRTPYSVQLNRRPKSCTYC